MNTEQSAQATTSDANTTRAKLAAAALAPSGLLALGLSAQTSYRYLGTMLAVTQTWERFALCGVAESAILGFTVYAALTKTKFPAYLAYAVVLVQTIPAYSLSGGSGGTVRVALGPVLLAVVLHFLLGISKKVNRTRSTGLLASAGREIRERLTARLGIGRRGADSAAIARSRAADRAVRLATRKRWGRRSFDRLADAVDAAQHGLDTDAAAVAEAAVVARIVRRQSVMELRRLEAKHQWLAPSVSVVEMIEPASVEIARPDTTEDTDAFAEPVISGWTGPRVSGQRRPARRPRHLRPARVQQAPHTAAERPEPVAVPVRVDMVETESTVPSQGGKRRPSVRPAVIALKAQNPDMPVDTIAEILGVAERTVTRHLSAKDTQIEHANGTTV